MAWTSLGGISTSPTVRCGLVAVTLAGGLASRDCVLVAGSTILAVISFRDSVAHRTSSETWRAALQCVAAGMAMMFGAVGVFLFVAGVAAGWWPPRDASAAGAMILVVLIIALLALGKFECLQPGTACRTPIATCVAAAVAAGLAIDSGLPYGACAFAVGVALWLMRHGWLLLHDIAPVLAGDGQ